MKKILLSILTITVVVVTAVGATQALFSDTETSTGNTFTAGTIDISIDDQNPWTDSFTMADMKPSYTDYINFRIDNDGSDPNPVNVWKKLYNIVETTGVQSEPECDAEGGSWNGVDTCESMNAQDNEISKVIWYDLNVEVYNEDDDKVFWQTIYVDEDKTINEIYGYTGNEVYMGMIPANGYMLVEQSYHMKTDAGNEYQGDTMSFSMDIRAEQMTGTAWLENKTGAPDYKITHGDGIEGTLTYEVKHPTFDFSFTGKAPQANTNYTLLHAVDPWPQTGSQVLGTGMTDGSGNIDITGDLDTGHMKDAKVWLILSSDWDGTQMIAPWHQTDYLLETGLIWYEDTDL